MYSRQPGFLQGREGYSIMEQRIEAHDALWLRCKILLKEGTIPIETFDQMTRTRSMRIIDINGKFLEEQHRQMENEKKKQSREMKSMKI